MWTCPAGQSGHVTHPRHHSCTGPVSSPDGLIPACPTLGGIREPRPPAQRAPVLATCSGWPLPAPPRRPQPRPRVLEPAVKVPQGGRESRTGPTRAWPLRQKAHCGPIGAVAYRGDAIQPPNVLGSSRVIFGGGGTHSTRPSYFQKWLLRNHYGSPPRATNPSGAHRSAAYSHGRRGPPRCPEEQHANE